MSSVHVGSLAVPQSNVILGGRLADGVYQAVVEDVEMVRSGQPGKYIVHYTLRVIGPTHAGQFVEKVTLIDEKNWAHARREFDLCGLELRHLSEVQDCLLDAIDAEIEIVKTTRNGDVAIRFQRAGGANVSDEEDDDF